ncbi:putative AAA domain-containing protein [Phytophthora infestans]|uniref:Putative AAA domain-containing protein n=1 Tax=Phytophthora infestans TaxID=4787 RepID=A0A833S4S5_PHYIN|nr:putative AAA domain-containing protein [Phytophthora infestans]KAF4128951.1 putative AAA domain-containing protein [Phytophthora infestans]
MTPLTFVQIPRGYTSPPTLPRTALVEKLHDAIQSSRFVFLSAPSNYGKTTVMNLFILRYTSVHCIPISFLDIPDVTANELVAAHGLDVFQKSCQLSQAVKKDQLVVYMLRDAQSKFDDKLFWKSLIEDSAQWLPANVRFVISAIHLLQADFHDRPQEIDNLPCKFTRDDFLLGDEEALGFFYYPGNEHDSRVPKQLESPELRDLIFRECNGHVGALASVVVELVRVSRHDYKSVDGVISFYKSHRMLTFIPCFTALHMEPPPQHQKLLTKWLTVGFSCGSDWSDEEKECFVSLQAAGILMGSESSNIEFTCRLAQRCYTNALFPSRGLENPSSLNDLIRKVIGSMSMTFIGHSIFPTYEFPLTTASFLSQFMSGLLLWTLPSCPICPDMSRTFPSATHRVGDEFDFYVNADLHWGIDVRLNGEEIDELETRLNAADLNSALPVTEFVVVDIRGTRTGGLEDISRTPNRVTVVFKLGDFSRCQCVFGECEASELIMLQW